MFRLKSIIIKFRSRLLFASITTATQRDLLLYIAVLTHISKFVHYCQIAILSSVYFQITKNRISHQFYVVFLCFLFTIIVYYINYFIYSISISKLLIVETTLPEGPNLSSLICENSNQSNHDRPSNKLKRPRMHTS